MSLYVAPPAVAIGAKPVHPAPWHRSTGYPVTPTSSVDAVQLRLIWLPLTAVAVRLLGAVGACVSAGAGLAPLVPSACALASHPTPVFMSAWISAAVSARL